MAAKHTHETPCPDCAGRGTDGRFKRDCPRCSGTGALPVASALPQPPDADAYTVVGCYVDADDPLSATWVEHVRARSAGLALLEAIREHADTVGCDLADMRTIAVFAGHHDDLSYGDD